MRRFLNLKSDVQLAKYMKSQQLHIHIWIYNHPIIGVIDQISYITSLLEQNNYTVSVGNRPKMKALNIVIENFSSKTSKKLINFCKKTQKRVAVIMTEHFDFDLAENCIKMHGKPLATPVDYMSVDNKAIRVQYLLNCLPYVHCLFQLGDLPQLQNITTVMPGMMVRKLPFPKLERISPSKKQNLKDHFLFTGYITHYRMNILYYLKSQEIDVQSPMRYVSKQKREQMMRSAKIVLNIPQHKEWAWLSSMRIIAALQAGKATISLGTRDHSEIARCCIQLNAQLPKTIHELKDALKNWQIHYDSAYDKYHKMAENFAQQHPFPHDFFNYWAITDKI